MNCQQFEQRLNDVLDERRDPAADPQLAEHVRTCPACRAVQDSYARLLAAVAGFVRPVPSPELSERIQRSLEDCPQPASTVSTGPARRWTWMALAASILVLLALGITQRRFDQPATEQRPQVAVAPVPAPPADIPLRQASPAPSAVAQAAQQTGAHLADVLLLIPGVTPPADPPTDPGQPSESGNWLNQMASGLAPLARSTTEALDFLLDAVPEESGSDS